MFALLQCTRYITWVVSRILYLSAQWYVLCCPMPAFSHILCLGVCFKYFAQTQDEEDEVIRGLGCVVTRAKMVVPFCNFAFSIF